MNIKELNINGEVYAKYEMEGSTLFLKMIIQIVEGKDNVIKSENLLINIIQLVEKRMFNTVVYLKI